jgi:hypothetical protein
MPKPFPTITLVKGTDSDVYIKGPGVGKFDFSVFNKTTLASVAMGVTKDSSDTAKLEIKGGGADILIHFLKADIVDKVGSYPYGVVVHANATNKDYSVSEPGYINVVEAP